MVGVVLITWFGWFIPGEAIITPKHWIPTTMDACEFALQFPISVLGVAYPCAQGLATPIAVMVASRMGIDQDVLIKGGNALEKACKVTIVVFDKTGTLIVGKPKVVSAVLFFECSIEELCDMTIAIEARSEHPIAEAVVVHAKRFNKKFGSSTEKVLDVVEFELHMRINFPIFNLEDKVISTEERLLIFAQFELLPCYGFGDLASKHYMVTNVLASENLETFENSGNGDYSDTLDVQLNQCVIACGKRLLKTWLKRPLYHVELLWDTMELLQLRSNYKCSSQYNVTMNRCYKHVLCLTVV